MDIGQRERIPVNRIRPLPEEFQYKPAFAIPCCLNQVCPSNGNDPTVWKAIDPVHDEFNRLMVNTVTCTMREKQDQSYYIVDIDIPSKYRSGTRVEEYKQHRICYRRRDFLDQIG